jgi:hypothetical protein
MFLAELFAFTIPFFIPFIHYLGRVRGPAAPPLVARYARLKPLNRSVPLRSTSLAAIMLLRSQFDQPKADYKNKKNTRQKKEGFAVADRRLYINLSEPENEHRHYWHGNVAASLFETSRKYGFTRSKDEE